MSFDPPEENRDWAEALSLPFPLLSDPTREVTRAYEAEREPDDPFAGFPQRITYLIDQQGTIARAYLVARDRIAEHPGDVLADLAALNALERPAG